MRGLHWTERRIHDAQRLTRAALNFSGPSQVADRSRGAERLLIVVAGYKEWLWPYTLDRLPRVLPPDFDVCVVSAGLRHPALERIAERNGWSYLSSTRNAIALVQNLAIRRHPSARWLFKVDEDVLVSDGYFDALHEGYERVVDEGIYHPGFCAPVLNVNGFSFLTFLETLGLTEEFRREFGEIRRRIDGVPIYADADAARWVWERTLPFDRVAARFAEREFGYATSPHRFSIGAILLERDFWEEVGGFRVHPIPGRLGHEEADLCHQCEHRSRAITVIDNVLAGHFSFWPQEDAMRELLESRPDDFAYHPPVRSGVLAAAGA